jgi:hypothetical protein
MRHVAIALAMLAMMAAGCGRRAVPDASDSGRRDSSQHAIASANSVFGPASRTVVANVCAGQKQLAQGEATVGDACFTGATNVVLCTDMTSVSPVRCTPGPNSLTIAGTGNDLISYARIK